MRKALLHMGIIVAEGILYLQGKKQLRRVLDLRIDL